MPMSLIKSARELPEYLQVLRNLIARDLKVKYQTSGLGFAWLPRHMIERELKEGTLKVLPLDQGGSRNPSFYLYSNKDKPLGPATQILIELLRTFDTAPLDAPFAAPEQA